MIDGVEMCGDPGNEVYTARTFSNRRYESKMINSYGHPVPVVDGKWQCEGRSFKAKVLRTDFTDARDTIVYDLTKAYKTTELKSLVRKVVFDREKNTVEIEDSVEFLKPSAFEVPIVTYRNYTGDIATGKIVLLNPSGGRSLDVSISSSAPIVSRKETIENPDRPSLTRLGFALTSPTEKATIKIIYHMPAM
jgi:hypothetical protein